MIAAWMLYCLAIGLTFVVVGHALERGLHLAGRPTRWAWVVALAGGVSVPAAAWLRPEAFAAVALPAPVSIVAEPVTITDPIATRGAEGAVLAPARPFSLGDLDGPLGWGWGLSSAALLVGLAAAALRLAALRCRWRASTVDGRAVLVSENVGPAVAGLWPPRVVIPGWALGLADEQRRLMLAHEEEHVRARDPWLLAAAIAVLVLTPWNLALWWLVQRLRLAVEMDCDARVLGRGHQVPVYGELLLQVGHRRARLLLWAPALGEPRSFLERRIRRMVTALPRWRWAGAAAALAVAAGAVFAACEAPRPVEPQGVVNQDAAAMSAAIASRVRDHVDSAMAKHMRPWIRANLERYYPDLLSEQDGPPVDVWLGHDAALRVSHIARTVHASGEIGSDRIRSVFPVFRPGNDAWGVVGRRVLKGLVRDNVRIVWVHLGEPRPEVTTLHERLDTAVLPWIREGVAQHYPRLLNEHSGPAVELWFVADSRNQVLRTEQRPGSDYIRVGIEEIRAVFPDLDESNVSAWSVSQRPSLGGLVRENVRVIWIRLREGKSVPGSGPPLQYPNLLRQAGIQGRVVVRAIIDQTGRAEPSSVNVIQSAHAGFDQSARNYVLQALFRPARVQGRAVRVLINLPIEFKLKG